MAVAAVEETVGELGVSKDLDEFVSTVAGGTSEIVASAADTLDAAGASAAPFFPLLPES